MDRNIVFGMVLALSILSTGFVAGHLVTPPKTVPVPVEVLGKSGVKADKSCTTIQSGELLTSDGSVIEPGFDEWGYNYQARLFNGDYCDAYRYADWCQQWKDVDLSMKWNDAWLSNKDCDNDGLLDRHNGYSSYIGSGAWLTNHQDGTCGDEDGETCHWNYYTKIVAAPADATESGGVWYAADGKEIGPVIWDSFATIFTVENDPCADLSGRQHDKPYSSKAPVGFGFYK